VFFFFYNMDSSIQRVSVAKRHAGRRRLLSWLALGVAWLVAAVRASALARTTAAVAAVLLLARSASRLGAVLFARASTIATAAVSAMAGDGSGGSGTCDRRGGRRTTSRYTLGIARLVAAMSASALTGTTAAVTAVLLLASGAGRLGAVLFTRARAIATTAMTAMASGRATSTSRYALGVAWFVAAVSASALTSETAAVAAMLLLASGTGRLGAILLACARALTTTAVSAVTGTGGGSTWRATRRVALGVTRLVAGAGASALTTQAAAVAAVLLGAGGGSALRAVELTGASTVTATAVPAVKEVGVTGAVSSTGAPGVARLAAAMAAGAFTGTTKAVAAVLLLARRTGRLGAVLLARAWAVAATAVTAVEQIFRHRRG